MKKLSIILILGLSIVGCSSSDGEVKAELPNGFDVLTKDEIDKGVIYKLKEKETGCYYSYSISVYNNANAPVVTQMFVKENGVTVPYCE